MHREVEFDVRPNRGERWPWEGHVHPLLGMSDEAIFGFIERDRELWSMAQRDPDRAVRQAIADRVFFRRNPPRLGEPLYRTPEQARLDQRNMYCGRGTGHLGTGLYFFGTLQAAAATTDIYGATGEELQTLLRGVYAVDMEHVPDERIFMPRARGTQRAHAFAEALLCWPMRHQAAVDARAALEAAQEATRATEAAHDLEDSEASFYALDDAQEALRGAQKAFRGAAASLAITTDTLRGGPGTLRPNMDVDELIALIEETPASSAPRPAYVPTPREPEPIDTSLPEPPADVREAIERYREDVEDRRFPGYHPMTYYMQERGFEAVLHASWDEFNSGDIGNIWYPQSQAWG